MFKKIRSSEQWQIKFHSCCESANVKYVSPNIEVSTRWNSTYDMIKIGLDKEFKKSLKYEINYIVIFFI